MTAAIIIARGGSIRLPRKNVKPFCGLPLVAWPIIQARCSHEIDQVYLSTDDDEIEAIGRAHGAEVIRRPQWKDADHVAANRVFLHALDVLEETGQWPDTFVSMFPTSPLRKPEDVDKGIAHFRRVGSEHMWPVYKQRETSLYRNVLDMKAKLVIWDKDYGYVTCNSGMFNVLNTAWYQWHTTLLTERLGDRDDEIDAGVQDVMGYPDTDGYYVECDQWQCVEVDTAAEFELAEVLMEHYILQGRGPSVYYEYGGQNERMERSTEQTA